MLLLWLRTPSSLWQGRFHNSINRTKLWQSRCLPRTQPSPGLNLSHKAQLMSWLVDRVSKLIWLELLVAWSVKCDTLLISTLEQRSCQLTMVSKHYTNPLWLVPPLDRWMWHPVVKLSTLPRSRWLRGDNSWTRCLSRTLEWKSTLWKMMIVPCLTTRKSWLTILSNLMMLPTRKPRKISEENRYLSFSIVYFNFINQ